MGPIRTRLCEKKGRNNIDKNYLLRFCKSLICDSRGFYQESEFSEICYFRIPAFAGTTPETKSEHLAKAAHARYLQAACQF